MPLKLNVGVTRKIGMPNYGSAGASCFIEADVDGSLAPADLSVFQEEVQKAFEACRRAVTDELANHRGAACHSNRSNTVNGNDLNGNDLNGNGAMTDRLHAPGHGAMNNDPAPAPAPATERQIKYAHDLACQIPRLGSERLGAASEKMFSKPITELTAPEASRLIEALREIKLGNPRVLDILDDESE
jgi:hypothetical protein